MSRATIINGSPRAVGVVVRRPRIDGADAEVLTKYGARDAIRADRRNGRPWTIEAGGVLVANDDRDVEDIEA
jgi:hypothetical protein